MKSKLLKYLRKKLAPLVVILCALFASIVTANDSDMIEVASVDFSHDKPIGFLMLTGTTMESMRDGMSEKWMSLVEQIDQVLAGDLYDENYTKANKSYLKITLSERWEKQGEVNTDIDVKARVDLPNTKRRLRLLFDSDDTLTQDLETNLLNKGDDRLELRSAALQWVVRQSESIKNSVSFGVRDLPVNPYMRIRSDYKKQLKPRVAAELDSSLVYSRDDKLVVKSSLLFRKSLDDGRFISNRSQLLWRDEDSSLEGANVSSFERVLDESRRYNHSVGFLTTNQPSGKTTNYFLRTVYTQRVYKDWMYVDVSPLLEFPREENFSAQPSLSARLHIYLR